MKTPKFNFKGNVDWHGLTASLMKRVGHLNPFTLVGIGAAALLILAVLVLTGGTSQSDNDDALKRAEQVIERVGARNRGAESPWS